MRDSSAILVVDDSPFAARALVHVLESKGLKARAASTMEAAMQACAELNPTVLVTDVCMPNIDLFELCRRFRAMSSGQRTSILLFSAHSDPEMRAIVAAIRADGFMEKRLGAAAVAARVEALCTMAAGRAPLQDGTPPPLLP
jgi:DNA-binding response OmpR family regulator